MVLSFEQIFGAVKGTVPLVVILPLRSSVPALLSGPQCRSLLVDRRSQQFL